MTPTTKSWSRIPVDITKSLHQEDNWHIVPEEYCFTYFGATPFVSHVVHVCTKSWSSKSYPDERGVEKIHVSPYVCCRLFIEDMEEPCKYCKEMPPLGLVGLWKLHNWDYLCLND